MCSNEVVLGLKPFFEKYLTASCDRNDGIVLKRKIEERKIEIAT